MRSFPRARARFSAHSAKGSRLSDEALRVVFSMRLGSAVGHPIKCFWGDQLDDLGNHALVWRKSKSRHGRHSAQNRKLAEFLRECFFPVELEPTKLNGVVGKQPDGLTTLSFERGLSKAWDVTVPHPLAPSHLRSGATHSAAVACETESKKRAKYAFLYGRVLVEPFAVETHDTFGCAALWLTSRLA